MEGCKKKNTVMGGLKERGRRGTEEEGGVSGEESAEPR